jgi:hypothetical protein
VTPGGHHGAVRHARAEDLDRLEPMLADLRAVPGLVERSRGVFYRRSRAFLHFHQDEAGFFADVRFDGDDFERIDVTSRAAQRTVVKRVRALG